MFRSHIDFFAVLAIAAGLAAASHLHALPAPAIADAIRIEAPAAPLVDCPVLSMVLSRIREQVRVGVTVNLDR